MFYIYVFAKIRVRVRVKGGPQNASKVKFSQTLRNCRQGGGDNMFPSNFVDISHIDGDIPIPT